MIAPLLTLLCSSLAAAAYTPGSPGAAWSRAEVLAVKAKLRMSFSKAWAMPGWANTALGTTDPGDNGGGYSAAKVLRLTFHDCLKYTDGTGGCDGCLNWDGMDKMNEVPRGGMGATQPAWPSYRSGGGILYPNIINF